MSGGGTLRLFGCRSSGPAFDERLRTTFAPRLSATPGTERVWVARQGLDPQGPRLLASIWESMDAMRLALGDGPRDLGHDEEAPDARVETYPILRDRVDGAPLEAGIARVARGVLAVEPARYAERVIEGLEEDRRLGHGPTALVIAQAGRSGFVTLSIWADWRQVEAATGASTHDPIRTKRSSDLESFEAEHYELLADLTRS
jgi:hypothetical protein